MLVKPPKPLLSSIWPHGTPLRQTPWGEIAWQLGNKAGFDILAEFDRDRVAPGGDTIAKLFQAINRPILILMDELMNYVSRHRKDGLGTQLYNFLQNLSEEARAHKNVVLAVSIPFSEQLEMSTDDQSDYNRFKKLLDRLGKALIMSAEEETSEIIRRRLFDWDLEAVSQDGKILLPRGAQSTCNAYAKWIIEHKQQLPTWFPLDYSRDAFAATYPFHPSVLSVFEQKWQALPLFQRTRGVLRLLALWVSHTYSKGYQKAHKDPLITLGTAPLDDPNFRTAVFEQMGDNRLEGAVTTDICGKKDAHAIRLDIESVDAIKKSRLHRKVATTIFFESNGGCSRTESTIPEIRLNVAEPNLDIGNVETVLETMARECYYLTVKKKYCFSLTANINKILADRLGNVQTGRISDRIRQEVQHVFTPVPGVTLVAFPEKPNDIANRAVLTLGIIAPEQSIHENETCQLAENIIRTSGNSDRTFKSAVILAIADSDTQLREDARKVLVLCQN